MEADPEVRRYVGGRPRSHEEAEEKFRRVYLKPVKNRLGMWATVFKPEGLYIGYCGVYPGHAAGEGTLGLLPRPRLLGPRPRHEAARAFVDFGFRELGLSRIVSSTEIGNDASRRILENLGFRLAYHEPGERRSFDHYELESPA